MKKSQEDEEKYKFANIILFMFSKFSNAQKKVFHAFSVSGQLPPRKLAPRTIAPWMIDPNPQIVASRTIAPPG